MKRILLSLAVASMATCAFADEQVLFEGSEALSWGGTHVDAMTLSGDEITMKVTIETTTGGWWQFKFLNSSWAAINLLDKEFVNANDVTYSWAAGTYTYEFELTEDQITAAKTGMVVQGSIGDGTNPDEKLLLKKVVVMNKLYFADAVEISYDQYGNIESKAFNGYSDNAQVTFNFNSDWSAEPKAEEYIGWGAGKVQSLAGNVSFDLPVKEEGANKLVLSLGDLKEALDDVANQWGQYGINFSIWGVKGIVNTRGTITISEVEGFDGVGYADPTQWITVGTTGYATFYSNSPHNLAEELEVYAATLSDDNSSVNLVPFSGDVLPAWTPVIVKAEPGKYLCTNAAENPSGLAVNDLKGYGSQKTQEPGHSYYVLADGTEGLGFYKLAASEKIPALKAYLDIEGVAPARLAINEATGIESVEANDVVRNAIYTINGKRVNNVSAPGFYVINGKKAVVK